MNIVLFDDKAVRDELLPLTFTRPVALLRAGIGTIAEHWQREFPDATISFRAEPYLAEKFPEIKADDSVLIPGHLLPCPELLQAIAAGERALADTGTTPGFRHLYDIFLLSKELITADFHSLTAGRTSQPLPPSCTLIGPEELLFIEEGADVEGAYINTKGGPVYIGPRAEVQEAVVLRGPVAIGPDCRVRAGARLLSGVNLGPKCKVGGEVSNAVFMANSNKQHDGYLGDAVIGEWCNLGAGCTASNLKNDYSEIKLWNYPQRRFLRTGLQFCGLIMGDHSKAGINTMFNTATVIGVGCNIHGSGFPRNFVPSFSDGGAAGFTDVIMSKFFQTARIVMSRRGVEFTEADEHILHHIFQFAADLK